MATVPTLGPGQQQKAKRHLCSPRIPQGAGRLGRAFPVQLEHPRSGRSSGGRAGPQCAGDGGGWPSPQQPPSPSAAVSR